jgi:hypothetical protein
MQEIPEGRMAVCHFGNFDVWREWPARGDPDVTVELFDEEEARAVAEHANGDGEDIETRVRRPHALET